jgi:hypothetical protein
MRHGILRRAGAATALVIALALAVPSPAHAAGRASSAGTPSAWSTVWQWVVSLWMGTESGMTPTDTNTGSGTQVLSTTAAPGSSGDRGSTIDPNG